MRVSEEVISEFTFGPTYRLRETGVFTRENWRDRWTDALAQVFWPRPTFTVIDVDTERGIITLK